MMQSLRSRLIVGMLLGMAVLLVAAGATIYVVQRRQLQRAFDDALLGAANSLTLLVHPGPFGHWFDTNGLERLPVVQAGVGILFQMWSDQPIDVPAPRSTFDDEPEDTGRPGPSRDEDFHPDDPPPPAGRRPGETWPRHGDDPATPSAAPPPRGPREPRWEPWSRKRVIRSAALGELDLPRLETAIGGSRFAAITLPDGRPGRAVGVQFRVPHLLPGPRRTPPAELTVVAAASTAQLEQQLGFLGMLLAATALGTMAVAAGVAWLVVGRGLRPLARVARRIAALDETGLKQRIDDRGVPLEIVAVVKQLNGLLGRLDEAFERERALTADVAHELRTPVAEVRTITEITLRRQRDPEEYRAALGEVLDAITALQGLVEKLLVLARLEAGQIKLALGPVALAPRLEQHWGRVGSRAAARGVTFEARVPEEVAVLADAPLLDVVLVNALSNAAACALDGSRISAEVSDDGTRCRLTIVNAGCELSAAEVGRVFDRFWRADAARSRSGLNCGLGLTLVRRAMEAMGGQAAARVDPERCFVLTLAFQSAAGSG
jgi:signal transduction histidine kinase